MRDTEKEFAMYGMSEADIREDYMESLTARHCGIDMVIAGILSDCQELLSMNPAAASEKIRNSRLIKYQGKTHTEPTIWHENKAGHISAYPYSCALRAGASYNYLLVNGERRLTEREMLRLQGFPDEFKILGSYSTFRRLIGNSVAVSCVEIVMYCLLNTIENFAIDLK